MWRDEVVKRETFLMVVSKPRPSVSVRGGTVVVVGGGGRGRGDGCYQGGENGDGYLQQAGRADDDV